jgi:flagellar hook assembly protein FlgD
MIWFDVAEKTDVAVSVYNVLGQKVSTLLYGTMDAGIYQVEWKGLMDSGEQLPSGLYFYELKSPLFNSVKKMVLVR